MLVWGLLSGGDHVMSVVMGEDYYQASGMTAPQMAYFSSLPLWVTVAWTVSVWGALAGAIALMLRRRLATFLFAASVVGTILYIVHTCFLSEGIAAMGAVWFMPIVIAVILIALAAYTSAMTRRGLLR
jgi:hypothetical protein